MHRTVCNQVADATKNLMDNDGEDPYDASRDDYTGEEFLSGQGKAKNQKKVLA